MCLPYGLSYWKIKQGFPKNNIYTETWRMTRDEAHGEQQEEHS